MKTFLRAIGIVIAATLICAVLLALLITATNSLTVIESKPADFLPEKETVALFSDVSEETLRKFEVYFPELGTVNLPPKKTIALLQLEDGISVAEFRDALEKDEETFLEQETFIRGRFAVSVSDPRAKILLDEQTPRLNSAKNFKALAAHKRANDEWTFLDLSMLPKPETLAQKFIRALMKEKSTHAAITLGNDRTKIELIGGAHIPLHGLSPVIRSTFSGAFLIMRISDLANVWEQTTGRLDDTARSFVLGHIGKLVEDTLGQDVSFTYDIQPMLKGLTSLYLGRNQSGTLLIALEGMMSSSRDLHEHIEKLHTGFRSTLPTARIFRRKLDNRFVAEDVRIAPDLISGNETEYNNWKILSSERGNGQGFFSARLGTTFVLANDAVVLTQILDRSASIDPPSESSLIAKTRLADGIVEMQKLKDIIGESIPQLTANNLPFSFSNLTGSLLWSVEQGRHITTISLLPTSPQTPLLF